MNKHILTALFTAIILAGYGCSTRTDKPDSGNLKIVVSIPPQLYLVESIGGEYVDAESVMSSDANPESFEPTVAAMLSIADADAYIPVGVLDFEKPLINKLRSNSPGLEIINGSEGVNLLYDTHGHCEEHGHHHHDSAADPHVWCSVKNMRKMAGNVADVLIDKDAAHKDYYIARRDSLYNRLDSIDNALSDRIRQSGISSFLVWHPSLSYFANDYGLNQIVVGSHVKELSIRQLQNRINDAVSSGAGVFFMQQEFDSDQAEVINSQLDADIVRLNTMSREWENEINKIADGFSKE